MVQVTFKGQPVTLLGNQVRIGDQAPDFTVLDSSLNEVTLADSQGKVRLISVVPSIDTGVCDQQTRRFNEEAAQLEGVSLLTISVDLPFAQSRWCAASGVDKIQLLSDHRDLSFGMAYGVVIKELRLLTRSVFVIDREGKLSYVEYVPEVTNHPNYAAALEATRQLL